MAAVSRDARRSRTPASCSGAGRPPDAGGRPGFIAAAFAQAFFAISVSIRGACALKGYSRCVGRGEQCGSFVCSPSRANVVGQATWRSLLGAVHLAGVACEAKKKYKHLSWHMCCAFSFVMWGCGGVGNGNVVERGCGWWVGAPEHCTCAVSYACSYVLVALICVIVNFDSGF